MTIIIKVFDCRKPSAPIVKPTDVPRKIVVMLMISFCADLVMRSTTPDSRMILPSINIATRADAGGTTRMTATMTTRAKTIRSSLPTGRSVCMRILRSASVVSHFMIGG